MERVYHYKAVDKMGRSVRDSLMIEDEIALKRLLAQDDLFLLDYKPQSMLEQTIEKLSFKPESIHLFTTRMASGLQVGIPLGVILENLIEDQTGYFKQVLKGVEHHVKSGKTLAESLRMYSDYFSETYCTIVNSGQGSGRLGETFFHLGKLYEQQKENRNKIRKAKAQPMFYITVLLVFTVAASIWILPNFVKIFESSKIQIPLPTQILLGVGELITQGGIFILLTLVGLGMFWKLSVQKSNGVQYLLDHILLKIPIIRSIIRYSETSLFVHFWHLFALSGVPLVQTLESLADVPKNQVVRESIRRVQGNVSKGMSVSRAFNEQPFFADNWVFRELVKIGDDNKEMESILPKIFQDHDQAMIESIDRLMPWINKLLLAISGIVVGMFVAGIFLPILMMFEVAKNL